MKPLPKLKSISKTSKAKFKVSEVTVIIISFIFTISIAISYQYVHNPQFSDNQIAVNAYQVGESFRDCATCPEMVVVPAGEFMMGSPEKKRERSSDKEPQHQVTISQPFAVGKYEVTVGQFAEFIRKTNHSTGYCRNESKNGSWHNPRAFNQSNNHPVVCVSWDDAQAYVEWLSTETGQGYRLLSESEWEYAARAGTTTPYYFGSTISKSQANFDRHMDGTTLVGSYPVNAFGLYDMHGNVWEWVEDCWHGVLADIERVGCDKVKAVIRGGGWSNRESSLHSTSRLPIYAVATQLENFGFRVARTLTP